MAAHPGPTLRAQWLGQQLRALREGLGLTLKDAADYLQRDSSTVSRFEAGIYPARMPDVLALLDLYQVAEERQREALLKLSRDNWQTGWWEGFKGDVAGVAVDYAWLESRAREFRSFDALVIPGMLQTRAYAEAVIRAEEPDGPAERLTRYVDFRMERQRTLTGENRPQLESILDQAVLCRQVGGPDVMREQLTRLADMAERPEVQLRVLPFGAGAHASPSGSFTVVGMREPYTEIGYIESAAGVIYLEAEEAQRLMMKFDRIARAALSTQESLELIASAARDGARTAAESA